MLLSDFGLTFFYNNKWSDQSTTIRSNIDSILLIININGNEFLDSSSFPKKSEIIHELQRLSMNTNRLTIEIDNEVLRRI